MLSQAKLHQLEPAPSNIKSNWLTTVQTRTVRSGSVSSDDDDGASVVHNHNHGLEERVLSPSLNPPRTSIFEHGLGSSVRDFSGSTRHASGTTRQFSGAMSVISQRDFSFATSSANSLYDTQAIWKMGKDHDYSFELDSHMQKAIDRYGRACGKSLDFGRSFSSKEFLHMVTNERLRYMPEKNSRLDKTLKRAEAFAKKFDKILSALKLIGASTYGSPALILYSCKTLIGLVGKHPSAIERFFSSLDEVMATFVKMSEKLESYHASSRVITIFQSSLAMIVDIVVDITACFSTHRGGRESTIITQFESRFVIIVQRLQQLKAEFHLCTLNHWCDHSGSVDELLIILRGFGGCEHFGLDSCPPAYIPILIKVCLSLHKSHGEHAESLMWFRFLWNSIEKHRHEHDIISHEQWFEVYQEYLVILGVHEHHTERLQLAENFRAVILSEFGSTHAYYIRASIEFAKCLEIDTTRYVEAVSIYEELSHCDHDFEDESITALIEIAKFRLGGLFECHHDLGHRAETLLMDAFISLKWEHSHSHEKVILQLTRIIEYHRKQKRRESITVAIKIIEEYIVGLLMEERNELILFDIARKLAKMYRELSSVEFGIKFIQTLKEEVLLGEVSSAQGFCGFGHEDHIAHLDRRCFVFIHAFEQLLCGYERENMLDIIIRDVYTETCLHEAWSVSVRSSGRPIHMRLAAGARLVAFLELKGRHAEMRRLRTEMWEMFKGFCSTSVSSESLWQLFELTLSNVDKKIVSINILECLVDVGLEVFKARDYKICLQLLKWSQVYFRQLTKTKHSRAVELAFKISESFSRHRHASGDVLVIELQKISSEILVEVLKVGRLDIDFGTIPFAQLNVIIRLLGERKNFSMLERILQYLWDTRMSRNWSGDATVATGRRLCEVKFAAGHKEAAMTLIESICYNLRDVYGPLHKLTIDCETLRASFHNTCGNHRAARDIHVHLLEQIGSMDSDAMADRDDLVELVMDQAKRLKFAHHHHRSKGGDDDKDESFYATILRNAQNSVHGHHRIESNVFRDAMTLDGEKMETKWKHPENWSLPIREPEIIY
ncbi:hypothetical protein F53441_7711 [Fusarium austroafricanum]|uniref:Uncharacterized protein n=1 Tax=Fusarium austroafricanum TaxID=2364996 RepID=A0A8H4KCY9_9HYPO|nr:hypothetical protein F53441_7711 [Fusarium austroafricanum]